MKLLDKLRSIIAQGESVASDEFEVAVPAARNFFPKWQAYSRTKKVLAVALPALTLVLLYAVGINGLQAAARHVFRGGDRPVLTQSDLKPVQDAIAKIREDLGAKPSRAYVDNAVKNSSAALSRSFTTGSPNMLEFNQLRDDVRQLQTEFEAFNKRSAQITTGSIAPKKKKPAPAKTVPSLTDPSSWKILP
jgi:hypothetical protein